MSLLGATKPDAANSTSRLNGHLTENRFLPNFCDPRMALGVVLISELLALIFSLARTSALGFLPELARLSLLLQWLGLTSAGLLCALRRPLREASPPVTTGVVLAVVLGNILLLSVAIVWFGHWRGGGATLALFPETLWPFAARNLGIGVIVTSLLLRYFFVSHEWRRHLESEARSRIDALQARIRPHFLFNSMNTIASLTRSDPTRAEAAVEDLADLFRASLDDSGRSQSLEQEIELARIYERIERLRLGDRLQVDWKVDALPKRARLPVLTLQPLLENAILHGIESLEHGGTVTITGRERDDGIEILVSNPVGKERAQEGAEEGANVGAEDDAREGAEDARTERPGQGIATDNIRERLALAFPGRAALEVVQSNERYEVKLSFPRIE